MLVKETLHAPDIVSMLISISRLDHANCSITFKGGICTIKNFTRCTMATVLKLTGLYQLLLLTNMPEVHYANIALVKININEAHQKFGHISHAAIKHAISVGMIT